MRAPPEGYRWWSCDHCLAACNFEAMHQCRRRLEPLAECGFDQDQPESLGGVFEFVIREEQP